MMTYNEEMERGEKILKYFSDFLLFDIDLLSSIENNDGIGIKSHSNIVNNCNKKVNIDS